MERKEILSKVDHTLLSQTAGWEEVRKLCDDGTAFGAASVCIPPSYVKPAADYLGDKLPVCTVIGFPNGYQTTAVKVFETKEAVKDGAGEIDMVINLGWVKDGLFDLVKEEIQAVKEACQEKILKVIIETCLLTEEEKIRLCQVVSETDAEFIKTSTGFSTGGATLEDVKLMKAHMKEGKMVKAAGGVGSFDDGEAFILAGADRLGTSRLIKIASLNL